MNVVFPGVWTEYDLTAGGTILFPLAVIASLLGALILWSPALRAAVVAIRQRTRLSHVRRHVESHRNARFAGYREARAWRE
jgi:hypothetical protein